MRKFIVLPLLVLLAACTDRGPIGPDGPDGPLFAKKCSSPPCDKGGGGGGGGGGSDEPLPTDLPAIVFARGGTPYQLVVMDADGSNQTVVHEASYVANPSWSPDGRIVFRQEDVLRQLDPTGGLVSDWEVACTPASGPRRVNCHPAWSPLGEWIAFAEGYTQATSRIRLVSAAGGDTVTVYETLSVIDPEFGKVYSKVRWPTWSPGGDQIAFVLEPYAVEVEGCDPWYPCILVIEQQKGSWETTHAVSLYNTNLGTFQYAESLEWGRTEGSTRLVFSSAGVYILDITLDIKTSAVSRVLSGGNNPVWSPNDEWIAWVKTRGDKLMLSDATGNSYSVASRARDPDWLRINRTN